MSASRQLKHRYKKSEQKGSFKQFVRKLLKEQDETAVAWFEHKSSSWNDQAKQDRIKNKGARITLEKNATRNAKRKSKGTGKVTVISSPSK